MKLSNLLFLLEGPREDFIIKQFGPKLEIRAKSDNSAAKTQVELVDQLSNIDPTKNKQYLQWVAKQYLNGLFRIEDAHRIREALTNFNQLKPRLSKKDINQYTLHQLEQEVDTILGGGQTDNVKSSNYVDIEGADVLYKGPLGLLAIPRTEEASCKLGSGTKWCTAAKNHNMFNQYSKSGELYIWIDKSGEKYQFWVSKELDGVALEFQFMNAKDEELTNDQIQQFREHPVVGKVFKQFDKVAMSTPLMATSYAAQVIGGRWSEAEPMIMQDPKTAIYYALTVIEGRWPEAEPVIMQDPGTAIDYATQVIKGRWPEAEPYIMKDPTAAITYAFNVIKGRWPEAEPIILENPRQACGYATTILKKRWPKAEPAIMQDPSAAYEYAVTFIEGRWPEAESAIMQDAKLAELYARAVIGGRWPEAEPIIMKNPQQALSYAINIIKGRWPEAEPFIMRHPIAAALYAQEVIGSRWPEAEEIIAQNPRAVTYYNTAFPDANL